MAKQSGEKNHLTNNFRANVAILAGATVIVFSLFFFGLWRPKAIQSDSLVGISLAATQHLFIFYTAYIITSYWFSPDIDLRRNRPGTKSFPCGPAVKFIKAAGRAKLLPKSIALGLELVLSIIHTPLNFLWRHWTAPMGFLFTHRGVMHWPIIGAFIKLTYLQASVSVVSYALRVVPSSMLPRSLVGMIKFLQDHVMWFYGLVLGNNSYALVILAGVLLADFFHVAVDYYDAVKNGNRRFIPPEFIAPRGILLRGLKYLKKVFLK